MGTFVRSLGNNCQSRPRHISIFPTLTPPPHALCPTAGRGLLKRSICIKGRATGKDPSTPHSPLQICWFFFLVHTSSFLLSSFTCPTQYQIISKWHPRQQSTRTRPSIQAPQSQQTPTVAPEQQPTSQALRKRKLRKPRSRCPSSQRRRSSKTSIKRGNIRRAGWCLRLGFLQS